MFRSLKFLFSDFRRALILPKCNIGCKLSLITTGAIFVAGVLSPRSLAEPTQDRIITQEELSQHNSFETGIWVSFLDGVYDVTSFVDTHPGGRIILEAAGGPVEGFWDYWAIHNNNHKVLAELKDRRIGTISPYHPIPRENLYSTDPDRSHMTHQFPFHPCPWATQTTTTGLNQSYLTPNESFFIRNHAPVPNIDASTHTIIFEFLDKGEEEVLLNDLKKSFPLKTVTSVLQCSGNRGNENGPGARFYHTNLGIGMVGNARWSGVALADVLTELLSPEELTKLKSGNYHVIFSGLDGYSTSTPFNMIMDQSRDVLLAFEMNDQLLPPDHGYPCRVLLPGIAGARNVKWIDRITISDTSCQSGWQRYYYKTREEIPVQILPINSIIFHPTQNQQCSGMTAVRGVAYASGSVIQEVQISTDKGETWNQATLLDEKTEDDSSRSWAWVRWTADVNIGEQTEEIWCRASDNEGQTQPRVTFNKNGYLYNGWHRVTVNPIVE